LIELKDLHKEYKSGSDKVYAVKNVNIKVETGDIYGIIGFSGAGKSTLVRCINRLEEPTSGEVYIKGNNITKLKGQNLREVRKKIGMIFQHFNLLSSRTVAENIAYPMEISGISKEEQNKRIDELLDLVELKDKKNVYPAQLSGGQKQRVGIARALANAPDILLCDEATSALDPKTTLSILRLIKSINQHLGLTVVIITHEMEVIKQVCTKVAVMEQGQIIEQGLVTDIFSKPTHPTTKSFVQNVTHDIPKEFYMEESNLYRLSFKGTRTKEPIISHMIKKFNVDVNILLGGVDHLQDNIVGNLVVELTGDVNEIEKAIEYLGINNVQCEVIKNDK
jgi:D-methionine transport system ATP-binding protein